jgi:TRAP-type C4-dicarboxylate transport system permease large subunit
MLGALVIATVARATATASKAIFGSVAGTAATFVSVAVSEMLKLGYDKTYPPEL